MPGKSHDARVFERSPFKRTYGNIFARFQTVGII